MGAAFPWLARRRAQVAEVVVLALLAYVPFLASPGSLSSDSKQYLYLDPSRFLARAAYMWDDRVGAGTVSHQHIGYWFPMGPWFWTAAHLGVSTELAQRCWLGTISILAGLGARWLLRRLGAGAPGAFVGALVYMLAPYQLAFTARMSILLLPWAALPWIVGLVLIGLETGGWRVPAALALIVMAVGSVNASALLLALVAPLILVIWWGAVRRSWRRPLQFAWRSALLVVATSLWWINGLRIQGRYGLPVLQLTENVRTVSQDSLPNEILRGLGNWFFYGREFDGRFSVVQATAYMQQRVVVVATFLVPAIAVFAGMLTRWRYRSYFAVLLVVATVVGAGSYPYLHPSAYGRLWREIAERWSALGALRNTPRVGPVVVLACAALIAAGIGALRTRDATRRWAAPVAAAVVVVVAVAFVPVWRHGYFSPAFERPATVPAPWRDLTASLQRGPADTRVLEVPGSNFSIYRWGNTIEPVTPGLTDRPYLAREVLPYGTQGTLNLLDAFDRRMQLGTFEPSTLAPIARLFASGTVVVRNDLAWDRTGSPRPAVLWATLTDPRAPGLVAEQDFGPPTPNRPSSPRIEPIDLRSGGLPNDPPPVARFDVTDPGALVRAEPTQQSVVVVGDGDGLVDAAAAGLIDGRKLVLELAALSDAQLAQTLRGNGDIVLTDTNRRRYRNFFSSIANTVGPTEQAGQSLHDPNGYTYRPPLFAHDDDSERSVVEQIGGAAFATRDGGSDRPEDRAAAAFDGDIHTAWRVGGADVRGVTITLHPARPQRVDAITLVQPLDGERRRVLTRVRVRVNGRAFPVTLGGASLTAAGQIVRFPRQDVSEVSVEILATSKPPVEAQFANPVGFAAIRVGTARIGERVRLPTSLVDRIGAAAADHPLDVVMTRLRVDPALLDRRDEELALDRRFELPDTRTFTLSGTARVDPNASDTMLDDVLSPPTGASFTASSHLQGDAGARASRAFDGDASTAWVSAFGTQAGQWVGATLPTATTIEAIRVGFLADGRHQVPTRVGVDVDGRRVATTNVSPSEASHEMTLRFARVRGRQVRVVVDAVQSAAQDPDPSLPVGVTEIRLGARPLATAPTRIDGRCRRDLLRIDDRPVGLRVTGPAADIRRGLAIQACDGGIELAAGSHTVTTARGLDRGIDIDRIVLRGPATNRVAADAGATPAVQLRSFARDHATVDVTSDGKPFFLVLNESVSPGWHVSSPDASFGPLTMVNGYANGWLVTPRHEGALAIRLEWTPQQSVWIADAVSALAVIVCIMLLTLPRFRRRHAAVDAAATLLLFDEPAAPRAPLASRGTLICAAVAFAAGAFVATPAIGIALAVSAVAMDRWRAVRILLCGGAAVLIVASRAVHTPDLVWLSLGWLALEVAIEARRRQSAPMSSDEPGSAP